MDKTLTIEENGAEFLMALGRVREAHVVLRRFGCVVREGVAHVARPAPAHGIDGSRRQGE